MHCGQPDHHHHAVSVGVHHAFSVKLILACCGSQAIKKEAGGSLMDTVIHDGAPNVGGAWASEAYSQSWLVLESLKLACEFLAPRGTFVTKIFRLLSHAQRCHHYMPACVYKT